MQDAIGFNNHFVRMDCRGRQRFGFVVRIEGTGIPLIDTGEFLLEVVDGEGRMPVSTVTAQNVIRDYGDSRELQLERSIYWPWMQRFTQLSNDNIVTMLRAALIGSGEMLLVDHDAPLGNIVSKSQATCGSNPAAWSDESVRAVLQLSRNEEARSLLEIKNRALMAEMIVRFMKDHVGR